MSHYLNTSKIIKAIFIASACLCFVGPGSSKSAWCFWASETFQTVTFTAWYVASESTKKAGLKHGGNEIPM